MALITALINIPDNRDKIANLCLCDAEDFTDEELDIVLERYGYNPSKYVGKVNKLQTIINHFRPSYHKKQWF